MFKVAERKFRVVVSTGPSDIDDRIIYLRASSSGLALHKANEYCKYHNFTNPRVINELPKN